MNWKRAERPSLLVYHRAEWPGSAHDLLDNGSEKAFVSASHIGYIVSQVSLGGFAWSRSDGIVCLDKSKDIAQLLSYVRHCDG